MFSRLWAKLAVAFVFVALIGIVLVAILANRATAVGFEQYLQTGTSDRLQELAHELGSFYEQEGAWTSGNSILRRSDAGPDASGGGYFLRVLDGNGQIVGSRGGQGRSVIDFEIVLPILAEGRQVGTLLATQAGQGGRAGQQYLASVNRAILWAGLAAVVIALFLGIFLAQRFTQPLRQLTTATQAVAAGDLSKRVPVTSSDEFGDLALDFNQMATALESSEVQRQQLLADTAHDLRTPISVVQSHLEAMLDGIFPPTPENLAVVHEETLRLSRLVEDLRTLSLADAGQLPLNLEPVALAELVQQASAAFAPLAEADGIQLSTDITASPIIHADAARLQQVLANLITNALRYAPQGHQDPSRVDIVLRQNGGAVQIDIIDSGPGLTAEQESQVFDRFWRSDAARSREEGGSGLGLAIAQGIVKAHGGRIQVASERGHGTRFTIVLPETGDAAVDRGWYDAV